MPVHTGSVLPPRLARGRSSRQASLLVIVQLLHLMAKRAKLAVEVSSRGDGDQRRRGTACRGGAQHRVENRTRMDDCALPIVLSIKHSCVSLVVAKGRVKIHMKEREEASRSNPEKMAGPKRGGGSEARLVS